MVDLDVQINWIINHWYYFVLPLMLVFIYKLYSDMKRLKMSYSHWVQSRQDNLIKKEQSLNKTIVYKWLKKIHPYSDKMKKIGRYRLFWKV